MLCFAVAYQSHFLTTLFGMPDKIFACSRIRENSKMFLNSLECTSGFDFGTLTSPTVFVGRSESFSSPATFFDLSSL